MSLTPGEIQRVHAFFGSPDELVDRRRAIYGLALELGGGTSLPDDGPVSGLPAVVDNPVTRAHLGDVLGGIAGCDARRVRSVEELATTFPVVRAPGAVLRVASASEAEQALDGALRRVGTDPAHGPALILSGSDHFDSTVRTVRDGVELALELAPELAGDLLPHVALFAAIKAEAAGQLGSASVREYPGLILVPEPGSAMEVAEALVHEGAHQKFFDIALTHFVLADRDPGRFRPPWSLDGATPWPFEQCLAAYHAYCCLASFATVAGGRVLHPQSLLPVAAERATVLGEWLHDRGDSLGRDGQLFVERLSGRAFTVPPAPADLPASLVEPGPPHPMASRHCGDWTLVMRWTTPVELLWAPTRSLSASNTR